jgi:uncharacterized protein (TIGR03437 family)
MNPVEIRMRVLIPLLLFATASAAVASESDALAISSAIQARHLPFGTILDPVYAAPDSDEIVGYSRCGDSALWTGHYLAAEAFRYKVTGSQDAFANIQAAIAGIKSLADVTGNNLLARCIIAMDSPYAQYITSAEQANGIHTNGIWYWVGNTSRDEYSGVIFGLAVAYDMVDDAAVKASISDLVTRLVDFVKGHNWNVVMPDGSISTTFLIRPDEQLTLLQVGRHVNSGHFSTDYDIEKVLLSATVPVPIGVDVLSNDSYFKFNLDYINLYNLLRLESSSFKDLYQKAYDILRNHTKDQQNAHFNMIDRALNGPDATRDAETVSLLDQWLQRPTRDPYFNWEGVLPSCNNPDEACSPVPVPQRPPTDFLWQRNPFNLMGGGYDTIEGAGIDYILPYWMARYYSVVGGDSVVSAATGSSLVSAEFIASYYGSNLASDTAPAESLPLPTTLAGVSVQVLDSAGVTRPAPLFYASPTQINFEIPAGTALGAARFTVTNSRNSSTTAIVQKVAPGLFTADSSGKGVALAQAIRVGVNGQSSLSPIYQCSDGTCSSMPINLGVDTPTYLELYGTGIRNLSSLSNVSVTINGVSVPVLFAGAQGADVGLDQVDVAVPLSLRGTGETNLVLTVDGQAANAVRVNIQ